MRFRALDGFRGVCALLVALYHLPLYSHVTGPIFFLPNAQMLLDFFFVASGFLISGAYGAKLTTWGDFGQFAIRRFGRLWPLHAAVLAAFVAIEAAEALFAPHAGVSPVFTGPHIPGAILTNLLLIHSLHVHPMLTWNAPSWTVSVEFYTYLIYAGLVLTWPKRPLVSAVLMAAVGAAGVIFVARQLAATYDFGVFRCFYGFFVGVLTFSVWKAAPLKLSSHPRVAAAVEVGATLGVFAYIALIGGPPFGFAGPLVFALFIWIYAAEQGPVTRVFSCKPLVWLGEISYSIYLVHYLIIIVIDLVLRALEKYAHINFEALGMHGLDTAWFVRMPSLWAADPIVLVYLVLVVLTASQTYRFIEQPGRALIKLPRKSRPLVGVACPTVQDSRSLSA
jgi:peptidoglycan/LPS O-acetylase OafA/YrhL